MADKLCESTWTQFTKRQKLELEDGALLKALERFDKCAEDKPEPRLQALEEVAEQVRKQVAAQVKRKKTLGDKAFGELKDKLQELLDAAEKLQEDARQAIERAKHAAKGVANEGDAASEEDEEASPALLTTKMVPLLRKLRKGGVVMQALIAVAGKETVLLLAPKPISPARGKLLKEQLTHPGGLKFVRGECTLEDNALTFIVQSGAAGLAKCLKAALLKQTELRLKVRVRGEDGEEEEDGEGDGAEAEGGGAPAASSDAEAEAALAQLAGRLVALRARLDDSAAYRTPIGEDIRRRVDDVSARLQARQPEGVAKQLDQIEQIAKAVEARKGGVAGAAAQGDAQTQARAAADALLQTLDAALGAERERLAGLTEAGFRTAAESRLATLQAGRDTAAGTVGTAPRTAAQQKVLAAVPALTKAVDDALAAQALNPRFVALRSRLDALDAYRTPIGEDIRKRVEAVAARLQACDPDGVAKLLDQLDQIAKAVQAKRGGATAAAAQGDAKIQARAAADALLAQLDAALLAQRERLAGLTDAALRAPLEARLATLEGTRDQAARTVGDALRAVAQRQVLDALPALGTALDAALSTQSLKQHYETGRAAIAADVAKAGAALKAARDRFTAPVASAFDAALKVDQDLAGQAAWKDARDALPTLQAAAAAVVTAGDAADAYAKRVAALAADTGTARQVVDAGLPDALQRLKTAWTDSAAEVARCVLDKDWSAARAALEKRKSEVVDVLKDVGANGRPVLDALARLAADHQRANKLMQDTPDRFKPAMKPAEQKAVGDVEKALAGLKWVDAKKAVDALALAIKDVLDAQKAWEALELDRSKGLDAYLEVRRYLTNESIYFPAGLRDGYQAAEAAWHQAYADADWPGARAALQQLKDEAALMLPTFRSAQAYYKGMTSIGADMQEANRLLLAGDSRLTLEVDAMNAIYNEIGAHVAALEWAEAADKVLPLRDAARALVDANDKLSGRLQFETELGKVKGLHEARAIALRPPTGLAAALPEAFRQAQAAADALRDAKDFGSVASTMPAVLADVRKAVKDLLDARGVLDSGRKAFDTEMQKIAELETARTMARAGAASLAGAIAAFNTADAAAKLSSVEGRWTAALADAKTLATRTTELVAARGKANGAATDDTWAALQLQLDGLAERTRVALLASPVPFIARLQEGVRVPAAAAKAAIAAKKDRVAAEVALGALTAGLAASEKAREEHDAHLVKRKAAADGAVKAALDARLGSEPLNLLRTKELDVTAAEIKALADAGKIAEADKAVAAWVEEAGAWLQSKQAYDALGSSGAPDKTQLAALNALPGGGVVFDALIASLPPDTTPQSVLKDALEVRYGCKVKQFKKKNPDDVTALAGLEKVDKALPDKSLHALYDMLGDVPIAHIKDKVKELVRFTDNTGGAAYGGKKIYMYCGRPDDAGAHQQKFAEPGGVLPAGEKVEPGCEPANTDPIVYFKFAALHEVGHAEDDARKYMDQPDMAGIAGWLKHSADEVAGVAAAHFGYDLGYVKAILADKSGRPPATKPKPQGKSAADWDAARVKVEAWCAAVREKAEPWFSGVASKNIALDGRVYQEAYANDWVSYRLAARAQGITPYQFRAPAEWFAELYAAYYTKKLKPSHPAMGWLSKL